MASNENKTICILGESGSGKSMTLRNLDPKKAMVINAERQQLPMENKGRLPSKSVSSWRDWKDFVEEKKYVDKIVKAKNKKKIKAYRKGREKANEADLTQISIYVVDSITALSEFAMKHAQALNNNDWGAYNDYEPMLVSIMEDARNMEGQFYLLGIAAPDSDDVDGKTFFQPLGQKAKRKRIERMFSLVVYVEPIYDDDDIHIDSEFIYRSNRRNSAKTPPGFMEGRVSNDIVLLEKALKKYYG